MATRIDVFGHDPDGVLDERVQAPAEVMPEARRFARILCDAGSLAVQAVKRSVVEGPRPATGAGARAGDGARDSGLHVGELPRGHEGVQGEAKPVFKGREEFAPSDQSERRKFRRYTR